MCKCLFFFQSELFQADIFPETAGDEPALTADEWIEGKDADPIMISLEEGFKVQGLKVREKSSTAIGTKNVMAGLSSKKLDRGGSSGEVGVFYLYHKILQKTNINVYTDMW